MGTCQKPGTKRPEQKGKGLKATDKKAIAWTKQLKAKDRISEDKKARTKKISTKRYKTKRHST